jgi:hypothetical protein
VYRDVLEETSKFFLPSGLSWFWSPTGTVSFLSALILLCSCYAASWVSWPSTNLTLKSIQCKSTMLYFIDQEVSKCFKNGQAHILFK